MISIPADVIVDGVFDKVVVEVDMVVVEAVNRGVSFANNAEEGEGSSFLKVLRSEWWWFFSCDQV